MQASVHLPLKLQLESRQSREAQCATIWCFLLWLRKWHLFGKKEGITSRGDKGDFFNGVCFFGYRRLKNRFGCLCWCFQSRSTKTKKKVGKKDLLHLLLPILGWFSSIHFKTQENISEWAFCQIYLQRWMITRKVDWMHCNAVLSKSKDSISSPIKHWLRVG